MMIILIMAMLNAKIVIMIKTIAVITEILKNDNDDVGDGKYDHND